VQKSWTPPVRIVFGVATLLSIFSTLQAYRLSTLNIREPMDVEVWRLLVLNSFGYWYVPAALTGPIFGLTHRFTIESARRIRALALYALGALAFSLVHLVCTMTVLLLLWPQPPVSFATRVQRIYLMNLDWALMTYSAIVGLSYALGYYRESQARALRAAQLEASLGEARFRTLEAELHPHFLFNTLHAISTLIHTEPVAADRMISRLSDLLRMTFERSGAACVPLHEELEFLQKYLEIEQTRFQDRLTVGYEIDPDTLDAAVPRLILQPLVENAIKHGIAPRSAPGTIRIAASRDGDVLRLEVRDNGLGLSGGPRTTLHSGIGLSNTRARLQCLYGTAQRMAFSDAGQGLTVELSFPFQRVPSGTDIATPALTESGVITE
jgi:two-component system, LytTR family, sensor kinase